MEKWYVVKCHVTYFAKETTGLDTMYNMYSCTFVTLKDGVEFDRFEALDMSSEYWITDSETVVLRSEIRKLKEQLIERDKELNEAKEKIKQIEAREALLKAEYEALRKSFTTVQEVASDTVDKFKLLLMQKLEESAKNSPTIKKL
jgi:uncharacterized protein YlxW (UPF0749 family)